MAEEKKNEAEVKPAKKSAPRKRTPKAAAAPAAGEAGVPAAPAAEAPAKKKPAPRKKTVKAPAAESVPAPAPTPAAPAPTPAPAPAEQPKREKQAPVHTRNARHNKGEQNKGEQKPAENPNAKPLNTSEERADSTSEERPLVRHVEQSAPKPVSVPGFATPETVGGNEGNGGNGRRKRRRNRNRRGGEGQQPQQGGFTPRVDPAELTRRAWKIFLGEVTEEGLALMDDRTAQEASRRAFRVAELFLLEAARHKPAADTPAEEAGDAPEEEDTSEETEA